MSNQQQHHHHHHHHASGAMKMDAIKTNLLADDSSVQLRAYQIYQEKGGPALDNWLEAEQTLRNNRSEGAI